MQNSIYKLTLSDGTVCDIFISHKKIKNFYIKILPSSTIKVSVPLKAYDEDVNKFINSRKHWIEKILKKFRKINDTNIKDSLVNGGTVRILDNRYFIYIYKAEKNNVILDGFNINIYAKEPEKDWYIEALYNMFLKFEAEKYFTKTIQKFLPVFQKYNISGVHLKVKPMKTKWGVCRPSERRITLNLHLYKTSAKCVDYVIFHELTHLIYGGHQKNFYNFIYKFMPDYRETEKILDIESARLL